jgi:hypothetical protein
MKFKNYLNKDVESFRKLNVSIITDNSEEELVHKIEKKYGLKNEVIDLIENMNKLLGKKKIGFTYDLLESDKIEKELKNINKRRMNILKIKFFESNSFLSEMKSELEKKLAEK